MLFYLMCPILDASRLPVAAQYRCAAGLFPTRMRGTAIGVCFNAPRLLGCIGPLIAGTLIVGLGGYGPAATIIGMFFILGFLVAPFLPETRGQPLPG